MIGGFRFALRAPHTPLTVADWRARAMRRVPDMVWAYVENGAGDESTLRANESAFDRYALRQRVLSGVSSIDLSTTVAGTTLDLPVLFAPTGLAGAAHWHGDVGAARAAEQHGTRLVLSSASTYSIEEVAAATDAAHWFQLYPWGDRALVASLIDRARDAGYAALVVTVDVPVYGNRLREQRYGMALPPTLSPGRVASALRRPRWCYGYIRHRRTSLRNLVPVGERGGAVHSVATQSENLTADIDWADLAWIRERWTGPLLVKGVLDADDAERCVDVGADGVVVSNHGGRQLNRAMASLDALPAVAERIGSRADVLVDGGIRSGADVIVALALGARAVLIGRPMIYGLAGGGTRGASAVLRILEDDLRRDLTMMGIASSAKLDGSVLVRAGDA
ncbi:MAG TPA: alpha-hydroxy acid oxidase [Jatrophihabitantaceae bacterium]|nr:alpha-hydroxy acid oxidase [Jatrophihabitantaceae bacterium]